MIFLSFCSKKKKHKWFNNVLLCQYHGIYSKVCRTSVISDRMWKWFFDKFNTRKLNEIWTQTCEKLNDQIQSVCLSVENFWNAPWIKKTISKGKIDLWVLNQILSLMPMWEYTSINVKLLFEYCVSWLKNCIRSLTKMKSKQTNKKKNTE